MTSLDQRFGSRADGPVPFPELPPGATILQVIPSLVTGGAERGCIDVAAAIMQAGGHAIVTKFPRGIQEGRLHARVGEVEVVGAARPQANREIEGGRIALAREGLKARAVNREIGGVTVLVASLDDIIRSKRAAGRPQDLAVLPVLEELRRTLEPGAAKPPAKRSRKRGR